MKSTYPWRDSSLDKDLIREVLLKTPLLSPVRLQKEFGVECEEEIDNQLHGDSADRAGDDDKRIFSKLFSSKLARISLLDSTGLL